MTRRRTRRREWWLLVLLPVVLPGVPSAVALAAVAGALAIVTTQRVRAGARERAARRDAERGVGGGLRLGSDERGRAVMLGDDQLGAHALILGASGAGKSTTLLAILGEHIARGLPAIALDLKGSPAFADALARSAAEAGRPFRLWTLDGPTRWNPLGHGNATELKDKLMCTETFTEPHYARAAERYLQAALQVLMAVHPDRPPTLSEVVVALDPRRMSGLLRRAGGPLSERVADHLQNMSADQLSAVRGMATRLAIISESHTGPLLEPGPGPAVDLRSALAGREVVLFSLNSSSYGKLAAQLGTLAVQDLVTAVGYRLRSGGGPPALIAIDEFSALGSDNVLGLLARGREAGASVVLATQELADLDRAARGLREQVLGNTAVKIAHRQDVPSSARTIAEMIGTDRVWEEASRQTGPGLVRARRDTGPGTRRLVERHVIAPEEITRLATGQAVMITKVPVASATRVRVVPRTARPAPPARPTLPARPAPPARPVPRRDGPAR